MAEELPAGVLSAVSATTEELDDMIKFFERLRPGFPYKIMHEALGSQKFWRFLDIFSGWNMKFPRRQDLVKYIEYVKIYRFCKARNFTDESKRTAARLFRKRLVSVQRICANMIKELEYEQ